MQRQFGIASIGPDAPFDLKCELCGKDIEKGEIFVHDTYADECFDNAPPKGIHVRVLTCTDCWLNKIEDERQSIVDAISKQAIANIGSVEKKNKW